jgi:hypothetical protein
LNIYLIRLIYFINLNEWRSLCLIKKLLCYINLLDLGYILSSECWRCIVLSSYNIIWYFDLLQYSFDSKWHINFQPLDLINWFLSLMLEIWRHKYYCRFDFVTFIDIFPFCVILTNIGVVTTISLRFSNIQKILLNQEKCYYFNLATFE